jgi:hypothetical protein
MKPDLHARVARTAEALNMSMNALINFCLQSALVQFEDLARVIEGSADQSLFAQWRELNPTRPPQQFYLNLFALGWRPEPEEWKVLVIPARFEDGRRYVLSRDEQRFVAIEEEDPDDTPE